MDRVEGEIGQEGPLPVGLDELHGLGGETVGEVFAGRAVLETGAVVGWEVAVARPEEATAVDATAVHVESLVLGKEHYSGQPVRLARSAARHNVLLVGTNRSGKTNALCLLASQVEKPDAFLGTDTPRGDLRVLALDPPGCRYVLKDHAALNLFQAPPGVSDTHWDERVARLLGAVWGFRLAGTLFLFDRIVETRHRAVQSGRLLTLADLEQNFGIVPGP